MPIGTPFHDRTFALCESLSYRDWSGYYTVSSYETHHEHEYNAIRNAVALIDISPLFKYHVSGPDSARLIDRVITRDASQMDVGRVFYTPWCDEEGFVIDDGTVARLAETRFRMTSADPTLRWLVQNARGFDVQVDDVSEQVAALALQGPRSAHVLRTCASADIDRLGYFRVTAGTIGGVPVEISRTGYTGDLGYEIWVEAANALRVWDAIMAAGQAVDIKPAGMLALDVARLEAGLILLEVDYTSARHAMNPEQNYSPFEVGLGRLVTFDKADYVGRRALQAEQAAGGPARRLVGLQLDWYDIERLYDEQGLPPAISPTVDRSHVPVFDGGRQVGKATSHGWSPILKQAIALASVPPSHEPAGSRVDVEWTVEGRRGRVPAVVADLPFLDLERKRA